MTPQHTVEHASQGGVAWMPGIAVAQLHVGFTACAIGVVQGPESRG